MRSEELKRLFKGLESVVPNYEGVEYWSDKEISILQTYNECGDFEKMIRKKENIVCEDPQGYFPEAKEN